MLITRHVYQSSKGGKIYVPLEVNGRILSGGTPKLAKSIGSKYAQMSTSQVQKDLLDNHGRKISRDYIQQLSNDLGKEIEINESKWIYNLPEDVVSATQIVSIGRDGTTTHIRNDGYRETMSGTISFHNEQGERLHIIYKAQAPEYGKFSFNDRFQKQIIEVKELLQQEKENITYIGLADGAKDNWTFLDQYTEVAILDYWHACEYLTLASKVASKSIYERKQWLINARRRLKEEQNAVENLLLEMKKFRKKQKYSKIAKEGLKRAITYFENHQHQMNYVEYEKKNYPIGSGVTEAACKVIVKQRLSRSGMKWNINTVQNVLNMRAIIYSDGQWTQFWEKINQFGFSQN
ncbi:MAG: ISKra4 family transposase [Saprospiraceae bacterium]